MRTGRILRRGGRIAAALFVVVAVASSATTPAWAHAVLTSSAPYDGQRLIGAPVEVRFTFDEPVNLADDATAVLTDSGGRVDGAPTLVDGGTTVVVPLSGALADGAYTASYRVVSADGHVVSGAIRFGVNADPSAAAAAVASPQPTSLDVANDAAKGLLFLGAVLLLGVGVAVRTLWPAASGSPRVRALLLAGWGLLVAGTFVRLATSGPLAAGTGWAGVLQFSGAATTLHEMSGAAGLVRLALLAAVVPRLRSTVLSGRVGNVVDGLLATLLLTSIAADGHAAAGSDAALAVASAVVHLAAMSVWLGGLLALLLVVLAPDGTADRLGPWSLVAYGAVCLLVLSGEYQAWRQIQPLDSLLTTTYGQVLVIKLALVAGALGLAWVSRRAITGSLPPDRRRLRAGVLAETMVVLIVVGVTTALVSLPPARTAYGPPVTVTAPVHGGTAQITVDPTRTGVQGITVRILGADSRPVAVTSVSARLSSEAVAGLEVALDAQPDGSWWGSAVVPVPGEWTLTLTVALSGAGTYTTQTAYRSW